MNSQFDYDVIVVGAGPAGISSAVRVRWLKRYHMVPCKVAVVDPAATLGGLSTMGTTHFIGPGWRYNAEDINQLLVSDIERFQIPHIQERVTSVKKINNVFEIKLSSGTILTSRSVILCPGMKLLTREAHFWNRGVTATSMGIDAVVKKLKEWINDPKYEKIVIAGSAKLSNLIPFVEGNCREGCSVEFVVEPTHGYLNTNVPEGTNIIHGTVVALEGDKFLQKVIVEDEHGNRKIINDVNLFVIDFLSYELVPSRNFYCDDLSVDASGFIEVDRRQQTNIPGLFAAGDSTGMPACVGTAIGEGIVAGFECYRYVYLQKFGTEPPLFAYYGVDEPLHEEFRDLPSYEPERYGVHLLSSPTHLLEVMEKRLQGEELDQAKAIVDIVKQSSHLISVHEMSHKMGQSTEYVQTVLDRLLHYKCITLQPLGEFDIISG